MPRPSLDKQLAEGKYHTAVIWAEQETLLYSGQGGSICCSCFAFFDPPPPPINMGGGESKKAKQEQHYLLAGGEITYHTVP